MGVRIFLAILQMGLSVWIFSPIAPNGTISVRRKRLSYLIILALFPLFLGLETVYPALMSWAGNAAQFLYRVGVYMLYLMASKRKSWDVALHISMVITSIFTACQIIIQALLSSVGVSPLYNLLYLLVIPLAYKVLPLRSQNVILLDLRLSVTMIFLCMLYTKTSFFKVSISSPVNTNVENFFFYLILLHAFFIAFLLLMERYGHRLQQIEAEYTQQKTSEFLQNSLESQQAAVRELRSIHHDIKNHLLMIQQLAQKDHAPSVSHYTTHLLGQMTSCDHYIDTGNYYLNALLDQKYRQATALHIHMDVAVDFRPLSHMQPVDICTIFSNALDNAMEACEKIPSHDTRSISIKGVSSAGYLFITIQNTYCGTVTFHGDLPVTSKSAPHRHGMGISNIRKAAAGYQGMVKTSVDPKFFTLTLMFPIPSAEDT